MKLSRIIGVAMALAAGDVANPPMVVMVDLAAVVVAPDGREIAIPAGSRIEACTAASGNTLSYNLPAKLVRVLKPCRDPSAVFRDGFE